jgi:neutral amino acid transport system ATP-binding protein
MTDGPATVTLAGVTRAFGGLTAVDDVTLDVVPGALTSVIGPNGAGKSTLFNIVAGTVRPDHGTVHFDGRDVTRWSDERRARAGTARTFQAARVLQRMSVLDNLVLAGPDQPGEHLGSVLFRPRQARLWEHQLRDRGRAMLERFGMAHLESDYARVLSGGQRKLLELGRILMARPRLVLLDEPLAGVNPALGERLLDEIMDLRDTGDVTFMLIEHDLDAVMSISDRIVVMTNGAVLTQGLPDEVTADPRVVDAYLGVAAPTVDGDS